MDSISIPSIQNVPYTRDRLFYKERNAAGLERVLMIDLFPWNYSPDSWASNIQGKLNNKTSKLITATYDVSYTTSGYYIQFKLTGGAVGESSRILTDHELSEMAYHAAFWGIDGSTWQAPHYNMTGLWHSGESLGEPVLFAHRVDLWEFSDIQDNWNVKDASGASTGESLKITRVSTWAFQYERAGVTKDLNVTSISAAAFTVTDEDGLIYNWNSTSQVLVKSDGSEQWDASFELEIEVVPGSVHTIAPNMAGDRYWYINPPVGGTLRRFHMVGKAIYPDPTTLVAGYQAGTYDPATHSITWYHGEAPWNLQTTAQADTTLPLTCLLYTSDAADE